MRRVTKTAFPRSIALSIVIGIVIFAAPSSALAENPVFGVSFAIARDPNAKAANAKEAPRVVDDAWLQSQIEDANHFLAPIGTRVRWTMEKDLDEPHGEMHTRADRDALTPLMELPSHVIDVFVVRELEDVDEPGRFRMGVCWTGRQEKRFIILSRIARPTVLAHELGHFFGNRQHSTVVNNLMSYTRDPSSGLVFLDDSQIANIKSSTKTFLETGRLVDVGPPRRFL